MIGRQVAKDVGRSLCCRVSVYITEQEEFDEEGRCYGLNGSGGTANFGGCKLCWVYWCANCGAVVHEENDVIVPWPLKS